MFPAQTPLTDKLRKVTATILDPDRPAYTLRDEVLQLKTIFQEASGTVFDDAGTDIASGETRTDAGIAISPTMAAMCVDDFARTVQFIRGLQSAIVDKRVEIPDRPVRVLYAGCGPWAPLAIPIMSLFGPADVRFDLLDIHEQSVSSVRRIAGALALTDRVDSFVIADAATFRIEEDQPPDLIVIEMLRAALESEPQVGVALRLLTQCPKALMIPEQVRVEVALVNLAREHVVRADALARERIFLDTVYKLDRETLLSRPNTAVVVRFPDFDESVFQPMLLTTVQVYGEHGLSDYDAGITLPRRIATKIQPGANVEFAYTIGTKPGISVKVV